MSKIVSFSTLLPKIPIVGQDENRTTLAGEGAFQRHTTPTLTVNGRPMLD